MYFYVLFIQFVIFIYCNSETIEDNVMLSLQIPLNQNYGEYFTDKMIKRRLIDRNYTNSYFEHDYSTLYQGMGVHYAFLWVGTPPQRVSVIIDTGSHYTAFPCKGCRCGKHMDPYFDPYISNSAKIATCSRSSQDNKCYFKQSYSEGSSWHAFKVTDKLTMGDSNYSSISRKSSNWSILFEFGCQDSESGLFRTQNIDGIMGMSASEDTLPYKLFNQNIASTKAFTLCMRNGGGYISLGANNPIYPSMQYIKLIKSNGWFTTKLIDIFMKQYDNKETVSLTKFSTLNIDKCNKGKGVIVDSGTTDTYLPSLFRNSFSQLFHKLSNVKYSNNHITLTIDQYNSLPTIIYRFEGVSTNEFIDIECPPKSYTEKLNNYNPSKYAFRIYLTENSGVVLGSNFMNRYMINFDIDNKRLGIQPSNCSLDYDRNNNYNITTSEYNNIIHRPLLPKKQKTKSHSNHINVKMGD